MAEKRISATFASNLADAFTDTTVDPKTTDGPTDQKETVYLNNKFDDWLGYYDEIAELGIAIDTKATWTVGKGFKADPEDKAIISFIKGIGIDGFNTILENCIRTYHIGGDSFCEIIRDDETGDVTNLKPLDPSSIKIIANREGRIIRYEQISKVKFPTKKYTPDKIFHLARNRVADEIHGQSMIKRLEQKLLALKEILVAAQVLFQRFVKPRFIFHLDTDDPTEIAAFKAKNDAATGIGENLYVPKDVVVPEMMSLAPNATLNPLPYIEMLTNSIFQAAGVPRIIVGGSFETTEATAKILYLAFQQTIEEEQLYIEEQVLAQLDLKIELEFPASLENELLSDNKKDGAQNIDASETTAGEGQ